MPSRQSNKVARILLWYVLKDCFSFFGLALAAFVGVLLTVQLLRISDLIVNRGVSGHDIALMFIAVIPTFLELAIPMAAVIGIMLAVARLSSDAELIVMRGSGVSLFQVLPASAILGSLLTIIGLLVSHEAKPWGHRTVSELLFAIARDSTTAGLEPGVFNNLGRITIYPEAIDYATGELQRVLLDQRSADATTGRRIFFAQHGYMRSDSNSRSLSLELFDGEIHEQQQNQPQLVQRVGEHERQPSPAPQKGSTGGGLSYSVTRFASNSVDLSPEMLGNSEQQEEAPLKGMSGDQLNELRAWYRNTLPNVAGFGPEGIPLDGQTRVMIGAKSEKDLRKRLGRIDVELASRWSMPFASLVLSMLAFVLGVQPPRGRGGLGVGASLVVGLGVFLIYYALLAVGFAFAEKQTLPAALSCWLPNIVTGALSAWIIITVCSERYASAADALRELVKSGSAPLMRAINALIPLSKRRTAP